MSGSGSLGFTRVGSGGGRSETTSMVTRGSRRVAITGSLGGASCAEGRGVAARWACSAGISRISWGMSTDAASLPRVEGVPEESYEALAGRYGHAAHDVLAVAGERGELAQPIVEGLPDLLAEAVFAARREQARGVADVLLRRTRLGLLAAREVCDPGSQVPERVAGALAEEVGHDPAWVDAEAQRFRENARAEGLLPG